VSDLTAAGANNVLTISVSANGSEDDALRLELTKTSAAQSTRGWHDYGFEPISGAGTAAAANDAVSNP
jgi:hypothetical protein